MSIRRSGPEGKPYVELPRSSELAVAEPRDDRNQGRTANGRFAPSHGQSFTKGWGRRMAEALGRDLDGEAGKLGREAWALYKALLRESPSESVGVRQLVAARARAATLAAFFVREAGKLGLGSEMAAKALQTAATWDARAERLAVTSHDIATKEAAKKPDVIDATPQWLKVRR